MNVVVLGGAGYIGSHTCKALKKQGFTPIVYDNLQNGHAWAVKYGPLVVGDLFDTEKLKETLSKYQPIAVMHFASLIDARASMHDPMGYYENNVVGTLRLLEAMRDLKVHHLVFSSTAAVYGNPREELLQETHPCSPLNVYGHTKKMAEQIIHDFETAYGLKSVILRYFNAAGADPELELGEAHKLETHLIPNALRVALGRQDLLQVFGDGKAIRDYIHVSDLAEAHVKAVEWLLAGNSSMTFNLGTGKAYSLMDIVSMVEKVTSSRVKQVNGDAHPNEPSKLVADSTLAKEKLLWEPKSSDLETIISTAYAWENK